MKTDDELLAELNEKIAKAEDEWSRTRSGSSNRLVAMNKLNCLTRQKFSLLYNKAFKMGESK